jgi:hypothetical protein
VYTYPYIFLGYMLLGGAWLYIANKRRAGVLGDIALDLANDPVTLLSGSTAHPSPVSSNGRGTSIDLTTA